MSEEQGKTESGGGMIWLPVILAISAIWWFPELAKLVDLSEAMSIAGEIVVKGFGVFIGWLFGMFLAVTMATSDPDYKGEIPTSTKVSLAVFTVLMILIFLGAAVETVYLAIK